MLTMYRNYLLMRVTALRAVSSESDVIFLTWFISYVTFIKKWTDAAVWYLSSVVDNMWPMIQSWNI